MNNLVELGVDKLESEDLEVGGTIGPVLDLIKRARVVVTRLRGVLVRHQLFDLASPKDDDRLETLQQILVLDGSVDITQVLIGDVQILHSLGHVTGLSNHSHEVVQVRDELLLDVFWPLVLTEELGAGLIHHAE